MVVLGSECCKETIITAVKDIGHLPHIGPVSKGVYAENLTAAL